MKPLFPSDPELIHTVNTHFGVRVVQLHRLPVGEMARVFVAAEADGRRYIVKLQEAVPSSVRAVTELLAAARFVWTPVVHPAVGGAIWVETQGVFLSLQQYLASRGQASRGHGPSEQYLVRLGGLLRELHRLEVPASRSAIPRETFHSSFQEPARAAMRRLEAYAPEGELSDAIHVVRALFDRKQDDITAIFDNATELGRRLETRNPEIVLTHGDVHFDNVIETDEGLYLIDWDWAMRALPAHDLMYLSDEQLVRVSRGYGKDLLEDTDALQYYRNHLMLRAIWFWLEKALHARTAQELQPTVDTLVELFDGSPFLRRALL